MTAIPLLGSEIRETLVWVHKSLSREKLMLASIAVARHRCYLVSLPGKASEPVVWLWGLWEAALQTGK